MKPADAWQRQVVDLARLYGWRVAFFRPVFDANAKRWLTPVGADGKGWPDLVCVRDRIVYAELKTGRAQLEPAQRAWRDAIQAAGGEWYRWRPKDWDEVVTILRR